MALLLLLHDIHSGQNQQFFQSYSSAFLLEVTPIPLSRALLLYSKPHSKKSTDVNLEMALMQSLTDK